MLKTGTQRLIKNPCSYDVQFWNLLVFTSSVILMTKRLVSCLPLALSHTSSAGLEGFQDVFSTCPESAWRCGSPCLVLMLEGSASFLSALKTKNKIDSWWWKDRQRSCKNVFFLMLISTDWQMHRHKHSNGTWVSCGFHPQYGQDGNSQHWKTHLW